MSNTQKLATKIGIIGGGQLGKMMTLDGKRMSFYTAVLDPVKDCPSHSISDSHIIASFDDTDAIRRLSDETDVLTYEFEHINADFLVELEKEGKKIYPTAESLVIIKDKLSQKELLQKNDVLVPKFLSIMNLDDVFTAYQKFGKMVLKTRLGGYDGKGNAFVMNESDIEKAFAELGSGKIPLMAEKYVNYTMEVSVLACRGINAEIAVYPVAENIHKDNILEKTLVPARINEKTARSAMETAQKVMEIFKGVGMFCVEMFVTENGEVLVNEVAPRPHNSGHYTIEACVTSQFENHIRAITGLPLGDTTLITPVCMRNILGSEEPGFAQVYGIDEALRVKGAKVHVYGKKESRPKRKMGHITVTAKTLEEAEVLADIAFDAIKIGGVQNA